MSGIGKMNDVKGALRAYDALSKKYFEAQGTDAVAQATDMIAAAGVTIAILRKEVNGETYSPKTITITRQRVLTQVMGIGTTDAQAYNTLYDIALDGVDDERWDVIAVDVIHRGAPFLENGLTVQNVSALVHESRKVTFTS